MYLPRIRTKTPPHPLGIPEGLNWKTYCRAIFRTLLTLYLPRSRTRSPPHPLRNPERLNWKTYCRAISEKRIALYLPRSRMKTPRIRLEFQRLRIAKLTVGQFLKKNRLVSTTGPHRRPPCPLGIPGRVECTGLPSAAPSYISFPESATALPPSVLQPLPLVLHQFPEPLRTGLSDQPCQNFLSTPGVARLGQKV